MSKNKKRSKPPITVDRISGLPQPIIHQILSLLPPDVATRTSALSKTFYSSWTSFPIIDLNFRFIKERCSKEFSGKEFIDLVNRTIQKRNLVKEVSIKFYESTKSSTKNVFRRSTIALMNSISKLELSHVSLNFNRMALNSPVLECLTLSGCSGSKNFKFSSTKIRSITIDFCYGLESMVIKSSSLVTFNLHPIPSCNIIDISDCKSLKNLKLQFANNTESWIRENLSNLSHLENLLLNNCDGLSNLGIVHDNLKSLSIRTSRGLIPSIDIAATTLETLSLDVYKARNIHIVSFMHLRDITLGIYCPQEFTQEFLREQVPKFVLLETLKIYTTSWDLSGIVIRSENLKRLVLYLNSGFASCFVEQKFGVITLNTPNLVSIDYRGCAKPFGILSSMDLLNAQLELDRYGFYSDDSFVRWWNLIRTFSGSKVLRISCFSQEDLIFPKELRGKLVFPIYDSKHVELKLIREKISNELVDSLLWLWPSIHTLCFVSGEESKKKSIKFHCESRGRISWKTAEFYNFDELERVDLEKHFKKKAKFFKK